MITFDDLVMYAAGYLADDITSAPKARRIALAAYRDLANCREWNYYKRFLRLNTNAAYSTGTIVYDHTGGASERLVTLTGGTFPTWAYLGFLRFNNVTYSVDSYIDSTHLTLTENSNPGADVADVAFQLMQDSYILPLDFQQVKEIEWANQLCRPCYLNPTEFAEQFNYNQGPGQPTYFTIIGDRRGKGKLCMRFWPAPNAIYPMNVLYTSRGRNMVIEDEGDGQTATTAANDATVTGIGTTFTQRMVGSVIRFYSDASHMPTGNDGDYPYIMERIIQSVTDGTNLEMDEVADQTLTGVAIKISDPADIAEGSMLTLLYREIDKQARLMKRIKPTEEDVMEFERARMLAFEADSTYAGRRGALSGWRPRQFTDYPVSYFL